jgi:hypothetical protein
VDEGIVPEIIEIIIIHKIGFGEAQKTISFLALSPIQGLTHPLMGDPIRPIRLSEKQ